MGDLRILNKVVASYLHLSISYKTTHIACQSPEIAPNYNDPWRQFRLHAGDRVREILQPCGGGGGGGGEYPIGG